MSSSYLPAELGLSFQTHPPDEGARQLEIYKAMSKW